MFLKNLPILVIGATFAAVLALIPLSRAHELKARPQYAAWKDPHTIHQYP